MTILKLSPFYFWINVIISLCFGIIFFALEFLKVPEKVTSVIYEIISVFAAIGYVSIFSQLIIDFITFLAFYFSIDEVILNSILLSAGNTIGDFFGNAALAKAGEGLMGAFATYSGQIFNNYIGFSLSINAATAMGETDFDIFGKNKPNDKPFPIKHYFLMVVLASVLGILIFSYVYLLLNKFYLTKKFVTILALVYLVFISVSMVFGFLSRN